MEILRQINVKTTLFTAFYNWNERVLKRDRGIVTDPTCSDTQKGEKTQANRNLNWEKHHLPMSRILIVEPGRKKSLNWNIKKRLNARLTVLVLRLESVPVESDNFHTFSLVEKAHVTIKGKTSIKTRMCWTHGLPWEIMGTKWRTNSEDCSQRVAVFDGQCKTQTADQG